ELNALHAVSAAGTGPAMSPGVAMAVYLPADTTAESIFEAHKVAFDALTEKRDIDADKAHLRQGATGDVLNAVVEEIGAGMVVMGAVARGALERVLVGSTAERVLNELKCDVLVVKPDGFSTSVKT
ncbi:MAG: universal stress protein, partial [Pseudomonadota bacterium]